MNEFLRVVYVNEISARRPGDNVRVQIMRSLLPHLLGKIRRFYLVHLRKGYVREQLASRMGDCRQCGRCCRFIFSCPMLDREGLCRVYNTCRWLACKVFPIDEWDLLDVAMAGGRCGYWFESRPNMKPAPTKRALLFLHALVGRRSASPRTPRQPVPHE